MKKQNLLKLALVSIAMMVFTGAWAQPWAGQTPVSKYTQSTLTNDPATVVYTDKVTLDATMPFWVWPSAAYNPDFDPASDGWDANYPTVAQINTNVISDFAWRTGADFAGLAAVAGFATNYVEIEFTALGNRLIEVIETPASGLCPADPVYFGVNVIDIPSASIDGANTALGLNNVITSACWDALTPNNPAINVTLGNASEEYPYHFDITYEVFNVSGLDASGELPQAAAGVFDETDASVTDITNELGAGPHIFGSVNGAAYPTQANPRILAAGTELVASQDYPVQGNAITVYRITYNNVNARISRKSDYLAARAGTWAATDYANFSYYPFASTGSADGTAKYIISLPTPVTGPIYHIANDFAY